MTPPGGTPDRDRVVETTCDRAEQGAGPQRGTGYLIAPSIVLTVRHVVATAEGHADRVQVRQLSRTGDEDWLPAREVITPASPDLDLALVLLAGAAPGVPDARVTAGIVDLAAPLPFQACGFPKAHREDEERREETARGYIRPDSESRGATVPLDVITAVPSAGRGADPAPGERRRSGWSGMSGAAVFGPGELLVGVVVEDHLGFQANRLEMVAVEALLADGKLAAHVPEEWHARPLPRVSNQVPMSIGERRFYLAAPTTPRHVPRAGPRRITTLLDGRSQIVPFIPRVPQQQWLLDWCETDAQQVRYAVLSGEGGAGKSRLARWLCDHLAEAEWVTGIVEPAAGTEEPVPFGNAGRPALFVLDYADHRQAEVAELLNLLVTAGRFKVRILAVVRDGPGFLRRLGTEPDLQGEMDSFGEERHLALADHPLDGDEREQHYHAATRAFAEAQRIGVPSEPRQPELHRRLATMTTPLLVHAAALLDLLDPATSGAVDPEDVLRSLLDREDRSFWNDDFAGLLPYRETRRRVVAVSTLVGVDEARNSAQKAASRRQALDALEAADSPADGRLLIDRMQDLYGRWLPHVEPDLLGEQLIADSVVREGLLAAVIGAVTSPGQRSRLLEVLLRMCGSPIGAVGQGAREALTSVLDDHLEDLLSQAVAMTADDEHPGSDAMALPSRLGSGIELAVTPRVAADVLESVVFPERSSVQALAASVYATAARDAEARRDYAAASDLETRAATARTRAGQLEAAQTSIDRALVYLSTAPSFSAGAREPLARVLTAGSLVSTGLSRPGIALRDALRGVQIVEELISREPGAHAAQLLEARLSLVVAYIGASKIDEALATARQAIDDSTAASGSARNVIRLLEAQILQGRGELNSALDLVTEGMAEIRDIATGAHGTELAALQMFRAVLLCTLGRVEEASEAAQGAEDIASERRADRADESAYLLAQTKIGAATVVSLTDATLALAMAGEASILLRSLYEQIPDVYGPYYIIAETFHARILGAIGDTSEASKVATRAARVVRAGFAARPAAYLGALLMSALTLTEIYVNEDSFEEAIKVLTDTHTLMSRLDSSVAPLAEGNCALLLRCLADVEMARDDHDAAARAARRALEAYDTLIEVHPAADYLLARVGTRLLLLQALAQADRDDEFIAEAAGTLMDAQFLLGRMPNDLSRRILALTRVLVAGGYASQDMTADSITLLRTALEEFRLDYETSGDDADRAHIRQLIRELEAPGEVAAADVPPERFEDLTLTKGGHRVVLGMYRGTEVSARPFRPVLVFGPQRSRKTTGVIVPALLEWDGPVVVTSVRDDVVLGSILRRHRMGGDVHVFEPFGDLFSDGTALTTWNPVDGCEDWDTAVRMAHALTEAGRTGEQSSGLRDDRFWYSQATLLLGPLLHAAALSRQTMEAVSRWTRAQVKAEVHARLSVSPYREAIDLFQSFSDMWWSTRDGAYATLRDVLRAYESSVVRRNSETGFVPAQFFDGRPNTLYLCAPPDEQEQLAPIFTALVKTILTHAYRYQGDNLNLLLLLDEAGNIARIDNLSTITTTAAGTKIQLVTVFHDLSQMEALYGPAQASNITNNHSALLVLPGSRDEATMHLVDRIQRDEAGPARFTAHRSIRQLKPGTALCVYEHLKIEEITLRSSTHDERLLDLARADEDTTSLVIPNHL
jgi:tetratricopeptide (TPR) repeat protein